MDDKAYIILMFVLCTVMAITLFLTILHTEGIKVSGGTRVVKEVPSTLEYYEYCEKICNMSNLSPSVFDKQTIDNYTVFTCWCERGVSNG